MKQCCYVTIKEDFFETPTAMIIENMNDGNLLINILLKLYFKSYKNHGKLIINSKLPYTPDTMSYILRQPLGIVKYALDVFIELKILNIDEDGVYYFAKELGD